MSKRMFLTIIIYSIMLFVILLGFLMFWVNVPVKLISKSLTTENSSCLNRLQLKKDEFGEMAKLVSKFFEQRKDLIREISEHEKASKALRLSEEKFLKAFRSNPSLMTISELESGRIIETNESFLRITGYGYGEVIGHSTVELGILKPEMRTAMIEALKREGMVRNMEVELFNKSGEKRICLFSAEKLVIGDEQIMLGVSSDITERKRAEEELKKKMDELEKFNKLTVGRELKMIELKEKIRELEEKLKEKA